MVMLESYFSWQKSNLMMLDCDFSRQAQRLLKFGQLAQARHAPLKPENYLPLSKLPAICVGI